MTKTRRNRILYCPIRLALLAVLITTYCWPAANVMAATTDTDLQSTSPNPVVASALAPLAAAPQGSAAITFSEFPTGTQISNQYQSVGILFGGDTPFITTDGANPTSPVLSGTPRFFGAVEGTFVDPTTGKPSSVASFSLDAGYFDNLNSTKLTWYGSSGNIIGTQLNSTYGIQTFNITSATANIVRWRIEPAAKDPAGFAIDNVAFTTPPASQNDSSNLGKPDCPAACAGDPINTGTGNEYQTETDFELPAHTGLSLTRFYNSQDTGSTPFGANWQSTWHRSISTAKGANTAVFTREDGRSATFTQYASGTWKPNPNVTSTLTALYNKGGHHQTGWQVGRKNDNTEIYSIDGRLLSVTTREGLTTILVYDNSNRLATVTGPFGHTLTFGYNASNLVSSITLPNGGALSYGYDAANNLTSVTYPDNIVRHYVYNEPANTANTNLPHALTGIIDENGKRYATFGYDTQGRAVSTQHANGADLVSVAYNNDGSVSVTDPLGNIHGYNLTTILGVVKPTAVTGAPVPNTGGKAFTFDLNGNIASRMDFNGNLDCHAYDLRRNLETARVEGMAPGSSCPANPATYAPPAGTAERVITTQWHSTFHLPVQITEPSGVPGINRITTFTYDATGNLLTKTIAAGGQTRNWIYTYNSYGQVLTIDEPRTDVTDVTGFSYDAAGNLATITNALGNITKITSHDADGRPLTLQDPNGLVTTLTYDAKGQLASRTVSQELTAYEYYPTNQLKKVTLPDGSFLNYTYNDAHQLSGIADALGNHINYTLDLAGNITDESMYDTTNNLKRTIAHTYDAVNRLAQNIGSLGQTTTYDHDANGNVTSTTDPNNFKTTNGFDALNRLATSVDPNNATTKIDYNPDDSVAKVTDPRGVVTPYGYDGLGNQISVQSPDGGTTTRTFDTAGNIKTSTDARGKTTTNTYDALNRLTIQAFADGTSVNYSYDQGTNGIGRLTTMTDPSGTTAWTFDPRGHVLTKQQQVGTVTLTTTNGYDAVTGKLATTTLPSGQIISYQYDPNGKPSSITAGTTPIASKISYQPFGSPTDWVQGNGVTHHQRQFDLDGNLSGIDFGNTAVNAGEETISLSRDPASRITDIQDNTVSAKHFDYDALNQVIDYAGSGVTNLYNYDANGNRTQFTSASGTANYTIDSANNRLLSRNVNNQTVTNYITDAAGNITGDGFRSFAFNAAGQLASATAGGVMTNYSYNGTGERVKKNNAYGTTLLTQDANGNIIGEYDGTGQMIQETIYLGNLPIGVLKSGTLYYVNPDHLGAPRTITDSTGTPVWTWDRDPFGNGQPVVSGAFVNNMRFPGQYYDSETGLFHNNARDYDPTTGRYIQSDPIGLAGGVNTYTYVRNNPLRWIDQLGLTSLYYDTASQILSVYPEQSGQSSYYLTATSGRPNCDGCDASTPNQGPIPSGNYTLNAHDISNPNAIGDLIRNLPGVGADWGDWRGPLTPNLGTNTFGRSGFFLHGGSIKGSAGCVDVGGGVLGNSSTTQLLNDIKNDPDGIIPLIVK